VLASYRQVLSTPGATRLLASGLLARMPQGTTSLAILLIVRAATHSYADAGVAVGAEALGSALSAPLLGRLIDAHGRRYVLARAAAGYALALWLLALIARLHGGVVALVALSALAGAMMPPVAPALRALLPEVFAEGEARERAYALEAVAQELIWITGPLVVALLTTLVPAELVLVLIGIEALVGMALFLSAPLSARAGAGAGPRHGRGAALGSGALRALLGPVALTGLALGATEVGLPALALHAGARAATGVLLALWSLGSISGGLGYGSRRWTVSLHRRYVLLLAAAALCTAPLLVAHSLTAAIPLSLLTGITVSPVFSCQYALVGAAAPAGSGAEAFTWVSAALIVGIAAGSAAGGGLVSAAGEGAPFALSCVALLLAAALAAGIGQRREAGAIAAAAQAPAADGGR
jgi:MFS family permease